MREILTQSDFEEMLLQEKVILTFYCNWSVYSATHGIDYFKEADKFFQNQKELNVINFWLADVSDVNSPAFFLSNWVKKTTFVSNFYVAIGGGNPTVVWLNIGQVLKCEFSAYLLKVDGIIEKTIECFNLQKT